MDFSVVVYAALGGIVPPIIWVWFWIKEDAKHPEPKQLIVAAFLIGMVSVAAVIPFEHLASVFLSGTAMVIAWAAIEEVMKFALAYFTVLSHKADDEPIDPLIYMITVALGFAAAENALFLVSPMANIDFIETVITGNFRFQGATLLHVLASSSVGLMMGLSFYKRKMVKFWYIILGLVLAIILHAAFNFFILKSSGGGMLRVFAFVWVGLILLLIAFERVKKIRHQA
ncbi:MAG: PrsW family intramembrane metalloprotease [Candidatus Pacebacteria bacterium]|nr:PrsW family intramembrane metalloprotease [Candidatus Paceibacterota bacterium]